MRKHNEAKIRKIMTKLYNTHEAMPKVKQKRAIKRYFSLEDRLKRIERDTNV